MLLFPALRTYSTALAFLLYPIFSEAQVIKPSVVGGTDATESYPWMVALASIGHEPLVDRQFCGGVLISPKWVLTAGHCVSGREYGSFTIAVGSADLDEEHRLIFPQQVFTHWQYDPVRSLRGVDAALILLEEPITDVEPIPISRALSLIQQGKSGRLIGWGLYSADDKDMAYDSKLREVDLTLAQISAYETSHPVHDHFFLAASGDRAIGAGGGDSGGPFLVQVPDSGEWSVAGIVSSGYVSSEKSISRTYFTNLANIADWIDSVINPPFSDPEIPAYEKRIATGQTDGKAGFLIWPLSDGSQIDLEIEGDSMANRYYGLGQSDRFAYAGNGAFYRLVPFEDKVAFGRYQEMSEATYRSGIIPLSPYQTIQGRMDSRDLRYQRLGAVFEMKDLAAGTRYMIVNGAAHSNGFYLYSLAEDTRFTRINNYSSYWGDPDQALSQLSFVAEAGLTYWLEVTNDTHSEFDFLTSVLPVQEHATIFDLEESYMGTLSENDIPYKNRDTFVSLLSSSSANYSEYMISLYSDFDAEVEIVNSTTQDQLCYFDWEAENATENFIVYGGDLNSGMIRIWNFDKGVTGSYEISASTHSNQSIEFDETQQRAVTKADRSFVDSNYGTIYYDSSTRRNSRSYRYMKLVVAGYNFEVGAAVYDEDGDSLGYDYGMDLEIEFRVVSGDTYTFEIYDFDGGKNRNFTMTVSGSSTPTLSSESEDNPPSNRSQKRSLGHRSKLSSGGFQAVIERRIQSRLSEARE